jgi:acyl-CoA synthetase (AMP-forming)/AMP-acid ligase II
VSRVSGRSSPELSRPGRATARGAFRSLTDLVRWRAEQQGDADLFVFLANGESESSRMSFAQLDRRARALAVLLRRFAAPGERALLLYPPGLELAAAFFGCLYAGVIAVPAYPPRPNRGLRRLTGILSDAGPTLLLSTGAELARMEELARQAGDAGRLRALATDGAGLELADEWQDPGSDRETVALLQYTSGSTAVPKGVVVTHDNILHNSEDLDRGLGHDSASVMVSWLPAFHDMGLIFGLLQPVYCGFPAVLMPPLAFLQRPLRWLAAISRFRGTHTAAPNFAYELCVQKTTPEQRRALDLSSLRAALIGAEPVRAGMLDRFTEAFAASGFRRSAFCPGYGLAEATLKVSCLRREEPPLVVHVDAAALERHRVRRLAAGDPGAVPLVGCGRTEVETEIAIVDPERGTLCAGHEVGEVWVRGATLARGYWHRPEESRATFDGRLAGGEGGYLRTGDLGFLVEGNLVITGRIKDLVIVAGRNLYPQDLELTAEESHPAVRPSGCAAFSVEGAGEEQLVIVAELERRPPPDLGEVVKAIRRAVADEHDVRVAEVVPIRAGTLPKTSSGKVQRAACRSAYLAGALDLLERPLAQAAV